MRHGIIDRENAWHSARIYRSFPPSSIFNLLLFHLALKRGREREWERMVKGFQHGVITASLVSVSPRDPFYPALIFPLFTRSSFFYRPLSTHPRPARVLTRVNPLFPSFFPIIYSVFLVYLLSSKRADSRYGGTRRLNSGWHSHRFSRHNARWPLLFPTDPPVPSISLLFSW